MARENKRTRDERRYGKTERLADQIMCGAIGPPSYIREGEAVGWDGLRDVFMDRISRIPLISADNVVDYAFSHTESICKWDTIPAVPPPFPEFFVEASGPWDLIGGIAQFGVWFYECDESTAQGFIRNTGVEKVKPGVYGGDLMARSKWRFLATSMVRVVKDGRVAFPILKSMLFLGDSGQFLVPPLKTLAYGEGSEVAANELLQGTALAMLNAAFLAVAFMNCKNVAVSLVEPDKAINRERKKAGLKPFLRYHTINIEPMKKVLREEGDIERNGLKKALHIARAHFATYTAERPLFGKHVGTFWVPAHVRGSLKQGVVVSDYQVNAPKGSTP